MVRESIYAYNLAYLRICIYAQMTSVPFCMISCPFVNFAPLSFWRGWGWLTMKHGNPPYVHIRDVQKVVVEAFTYAYMQECMHICKHICIYARIWAYMREHMHLCRIYAYMRERNQKKHPARGNMTNVSTYRVPGPAEWARAISNLVPRRFQSLGGYHICTYTSICAYMLAYMHICTRQIYLPAYMRKFLIRNICWHICIYLGIYGDMLAYKHVCQHICLNVRIYRYMLTYRHICPHI